MSRIAGIILAVLLAVGLTSGLATPAHAATHSRTWYGDSALNWAESHTLNHYYVYGGAGPSYDCSGLVMVSFEHVGINLPHSTFTMLSNPSRYHLHWIPLSKIHRGVIIFFGSGHVEFATKWFHWSYGAHNSRLLVGWRQWTSYYHPTEAFEVW